MRAARFIYDRNQYAGLVDGDLIRYLPEPGVEPIEFISAEGWSRLASRCTEEISLDAVRLLAPVARPGKILGIGLNYRGHVQEQGLTPPPEPVLFPIVPSAVVGPGDPILLHPDMTSQVDYEAELAVVIGREALDVEVDEALDYVGGYTAINDVSARDLQRPDAQWVRAKGLDGFAPLGPTLASPDSIDPFDTDIRCVVNGETRQDSSTRDLIFDIPTLIARCSQGMTLRPGDIIATGTPGGVGVFRDPPVFLRSGDSVSVRITGIGDLENPVSDRIPAALATED